MKAMEVSLVQVPDIDTTR
jgi:hypothetical protein